MFNKGCEPKCLPYEAHLEQIATLKRQAMAENKTSEFI